MLSLIGFIMIILMIFGLIKLKLLPVSLFVTLPILAALVAGTGFGDTMKFAAMGMLDVLPITALFIGAITYFGIMGDVGLFDRPVGWLISKIGNSVFSVFVITACVALITMLDGSGATTLLITVPAMLPIIKAMKIRILPFALIVCFMISVMNFLPWAGPVARAATVINIDPTDLWKALLPIQILGIVLVFVAAYILSRIEIKRGECITDIDASTYSAIYTEKELALKRPHLFWFNLTLTIILIAALFLGIPSFLAFLFGIGIALPVNYLKDGQQVQTERIQAHSKHVMPMIITILGAGVLLGILTKTGMIEAMAGVVISITPHSFGEYIHIVMGILAVPLSLVFEADTMNYGFLPLLIEIGSNYGVPPIGAAAAIIIGHNVGITLCMTNPTVYFGLGLFGLNYQEAFRYMFLKSWLLGIILIAFGFVIGIL